MKKQCELRDLIYDDIAFTAIRGLRQHWRNRSVYRYIDTPRPDNGLILICCRGAHYRFEDGSEILAGRNNLLILPEGSRYSVEFDVDRHEEYGASMLVNFTATDLEGDRLSVGSSPKVLLSDSEAYVKESFLEIAELSVTGSVLRKKSAFLKLLCTLLPRVCEDRSSETTFSELANVYIDSNLSSNISTAKMARAFAMSESTLRRRFKEHFGTSAVDYINKRKITLAAELLSTTEATSDSVSEQLGFYDKSYFYKMFKRYMGVTPGKYVAELLKTTDGNEGL